MKIKSKLFIVLIGVLFINNCFSADKEYIYGKKIENYQDANFTDDNEQFSSGESYVILDYLGHYFFSLPGKLLLWNKYFAKHMISEETKEVTKKYFKENGIDDVKVRFNEYAPVDELVRLWKNDKINPLAKYSIGLTLWFIKTIFPERLFAGLGLFFIGGGDYYDPYTNTVNIFSDSIPISLHEAGHAKDFSLSKYPTTMALSRILPFMSLYQEGTASEDAIVYLRKNCLIEEEEKAYRQLPPAYSTYLASSAGSNVIFFAIPGHMVSIDLRDKFKKTEIPECGKIFGKGYKKK